MGCGASVEGGGATAVAPAMGMGNMTSRTLVQGWSFTALRMLSAKDKPELDAVNELIMTAAMDITSAEWAVVLFLDTVKQRLLYRPAGLKKTDKSLEARPA